MNNRYILFILACSLVLLSRAQPGTLDPDFNTLDVGNGYGDGPSGTVHDMVVQPDGHILIAGDFYSYDGVPRNRIARLMPDGTLDLSFNPGSGANGEVNTIALLPDGKILIGGSFSAYNGILRSRIARLLPNGSLDTSFEPASGTNGTIEALAVQADGRIVITGSFNQYTGSVRNKVARLHANGQLDVSFDPGDGIQQGFINDVAVDPGGRVLLAGNFTSYDGEPANSLARINTDGSLDTSFDIGVGADAVIFSLVLSPDGTITIGGAFTTFNGVERNRMARLLESGEVDLSFDPGVGANDAIMSMKLREDGAVLVAGTFSMFNASERPGIAVVNANGTLNGAYENDEAQSVNITSTALLPDGKALIAGWFMVEVTNSYRRLARINSDGTLDITFNPGTGANLGVECIALQPDGKSIIGGFFTMFNGTPRTRVARLNVDGTLDQGFDPGAGAPARVRTIVVQPDGYVLVGGDFDRFNGVQAGCIVRLAPDGTLDPTFNTGSGALHAGFGSLINAIAIQTDGKIVLGGSFTFFNGVVASNLVRLHPDGTIDESFNIGSGPSGAVSSIAIQPDGKLLLGGDFIAFDGTSHRCVTRLEANGQLDTTFNPGTGASDSVHEVIVQPDGGIVVVGEFTLFNSQARGRIARLLPNGALDDGFTPGIGAQLDIRTAVLQPDGKVVIAGDLQAYQGTLRRYIARVDTNGFLDTSFDPGQGANSPISALALQPDGWILAVGSFTAYDGTGRNRVARILGGWQADVGVTELMADRLGVFPSPARDHLVLQERDGQPVGNVTLVGSDGRSVGQAARTDNHQLTLDVSMLSPGLHFVVADHQGMRRVHRFVKE
jgi:uncharacterized delta-60 repeat protein